jgi:hypothetical protein
MEKFPKLNIISHDLITSTIQGNGKPSTLNSVEDFLVPPETSPSFSRWTRRKDFEATGSRSEPEIMTASWSLEPYSQHFIFFITNWGPMS